MLWVERSSLTKIEMTNELEKQDGGTFIPRTYVVDFSQNGDVPYLKEQPGSTSYYFPSNNFILGMVNHAHDCCHDVPARKD